MTPHSEKLTIDITVTSEDMISACALYAATTKWRAAQESKRRFIAISFPQLAALVVQLGSFVLISYVLSGYLRGQLGAPHRTATAWLGFFGFLSAYLGVVPFILKGRVRRSIDSTLRKSDPELFKSPRKVRISLGASGISITSNKNTAKFPRSEPVQVAENGKLLVLTIANLMVPIRRSEIKKDVYNALSGLTTTRSPPIRYFKKIDKIGHGQLIFGILLFAVSFAIYMQISPPLKH